VRTVTAAEILAIMLALAPYEPRAQLEARAASLAPLSATRAEALALVVIDFSETTLGRSGVPYGACAHLCAHRCGRCRPAPLASTAAWALTVWRESARQCGQRIANRFAYYHSGTCRRDRFADREARMLARLIAR
tara:strand:+ start:943 stop:1347 length:405 start_codon:yes stop_codon:yes gene_type:complete